MKLVNPFLEFEKWCGFQQPLVWRNVIGLFVMHLVVIWSLINLLPKAKFATLVWLFFVGLFSGFGVTSGAHRLWTHRTYKAKLPLRIFLIMCYLMAGQYSLVQWARDHRLHHKFSDTDADPHNANRGFFFSHCGWLMMKRHPESKEKGKTIDLSDLWADPVVAFQQKYFAPLMILFTIVIPVAVPTYFFGEDLFETFIGMFVARYTGHLHLIWTVNSVTHIWGYKPYNENILAVQNKAAAFITLGEGWHNYHHVFPWDYRIGEYGQGFQAGAHFIDFFAWLGLAYDLKSASPELVAKVLAKNAQIHEVPDPDTFQTQQIDENNSKTKHILGKGSIDDKIVENLADKFD